jgi:putative ABC transport system permease protein
VPAWNKVTGRGGTLASGLGDIITEASTSVSARPVRSVLTILGAAIGVAAFAIVTGLTSTTRAQVNGRFTSLAATEVVVSDTRPAPRSLAFPPDSEQLIGRIHGVLSSGVTFQVPVPANPSIARLPSATASASANSVQVTAASPGLFPTVQATLAAGRAYSRIADQHRHDVVVLGQGAAEQLGVRDMSAQPAVYIDGIPFTVTGILKSVRREASLLQDAIIPEQTALRYWGPPGNGADLIVATRPGSAAVVASQIPAAILPTDPARLVVVSSSAPFILQAVINSDISRLLLLAGIIALLIGAAAIASITLTSVLERFYEIGVRRALGATRPAIVAQFLTEATILAACGGLAGTCIAVIALVAVSGANGWYPVLNPLTIIPDPLIGAAAGCAAGAYPALRAALLDSVEALRR